MAPARPEDVRAAVLFLESVLQGYMHMRFREGDAPMPPGTADKLTQFIVDGIRNPGQAGKEN